MSYPKTLGELWDMGPDAAEAWEAVEELEREATNETCYRELQEEQTQWLLDTVREFYALTRNAKFTQERSPHKIREMVEAVLDACQADY